MAYVRRQWTNYPSTETPIDADALNNIEDGIEESHNIQLLAVTDTPPSECVEGDKYFDTTTKLIYTATGTNEWGETGETPIKDILYIVLDEQSTYTYDGTDLISVGGSGGGANIVNEYSESTTDGYSANYINNIANKFKFTKTYTYNGTNMSTTNGAVRDYSSITIHANDDESVIYIEGTLYNNHSTAGGATVTFTTPLRPTNNVSMMNILTFYSNQQVGENMDISTNGTVSMGVYGTANGNSRHAIVPVLIFLD